MRAADSLGRAVLDHHRGERTEPLIDRDGPETREHAIERWYFNNHDPAAWRDQFLKGPLLDLGAGAGRDALYYQDRFETVAIEISERLVETMRDRGVADARVGDMFNLRSLAGRDRFASVHVIGTQLGLAGSMAGVTRFFEDLAAITEAGATAVVDNYHPSRANAADVFAYRDDVKPGLGHRVYHEVYDGYIGRTLLFRVFDPDRLREAVSDTPWACIEVTHGDTQWRAALQKRSSSE